MPAVRHEAGAGKNIARRRASAPGSERGELVKELRAPFPLTNLDKVLYPERGLSKVELIAYYTTVSPWMLPHVAERPLTLVRCPDGHHEHCFYQKHANEGVPKVIGRVSIAEQRAERDYMVVHDTLGLAALVQLGVLEVHTWGCHADQVEKPDQLVFDLDPDEALPWNAVVEAALDVRSALRELDLESFVKTTGGKGLHVVLPVTRRHDWDDHKAFARAFVDRMAKREPKRFVVRARKDLRVGRIFLDYLRNARGATAVAPYSPRARAGATVATPLTWTELEAGATPSSFDVAAVIARLQRLGSDPWHAYGEVRQTLPRLERRAGAAAASRRRAR